MHEDIRPIVTNWPYRSGKISVRKILGENGEPKIQMRLDLGLLQMELTGRPDGQRPNGFDTLYDYYVHKLEEFKDRHHTEIGFELSPDDCRKLRDEALMYYHRYLACFILEDYDQVILDTQRNFQIFDLCNKYAAKKSDRMVLEQYRPYVIMMNTRAKAHLATKVHKFPIAIQHIKSGLRAIKKLYDDVDQSEDFPHSREAGILKQLAKKLQKKLPANPLRLLEKKLQRAIEREQFEEAARLRDEIERMQTPPLRRPPRKRSKQEEGE